MRNLDIITGNLPDFLRFLKTKYAIIHNSNFFFRDLHYGVLEYLRRRGITAGYTETEKIALDVSLALENEGIFKRIDRQSWCVIYPEFALPKVEKPAAPAKA